MRISDRKLVSDNTPVSVLWGERSSYKPEGRDSRPMKWIFSICLVLPAALGPGIYSASNRNEYQKQKHNVFGE
jgi:hypothetical protein